MSFWALLRAWTLAKLVEGTFELVNVTVQKPVVQACLQKIGVMS